MTPQMQTSASILMKASLNTRYCININNQRSSKNYINTTSHITINKYVNTGKPVNTIHINTNNRINTNNHINTNGYYKIYITTISTNTMPIPKLVVTIATGKKKTASMLATTPIGKHQY